MDIYIYIAYYMHIYVCAYIYIYVYISYLVAQQGGGVVFEKGAAELAHARHVPTVAERKHTLVPEFAVMAWR
jgi:hypothetical protein